MKTVLLAAGLSGALAAIPGLVYMLRQENAETWTRDVFYVLLACGGAILGAVVGSTWAILEVFHGRPTVGPFRWTNVGGELWALIKEWIW